MYKYNHNSITKIDYNVTQKKEFRWYLDTDVEQLNKLEKKWRIMCVLDL